MLDLVVVSPSLIYKHIAKSKLLERAYTLLENDYEVQELLKMSNIMAVTRLRYNDHGVVHARIVAGTALELLDLLTSAKLVPTTLRDGTAHNMDEVRLIVLMAAYLHDIGNAIHRIRHEFTGALLAKSILDRLLPDLIGESGKHAIALRQEIMHAIFATEYDTECLTVEAGTVKIADGLDMSEGRARIPYKLGKMDMHAVSALSIKAVELSRGDHKPIVIRVFMEDLAGLFQIEQVLMPKVHTSGLQDYLEIVIESRDRIIKYYPRS